MIYVISWLLSAIVGTLIGIFKGRPTAGAFWGLVLGPLGWLLIALSPDQRPKCSECGGTTVLGARKCKHCGSLIDQGHSQDHSLYNSIVLRRTWCDAVFVFVIVAVIGYGWQRHVEEQIEARQVYESINRSLNAMRQSDKPAHDFSSADFHRLQKGMSYNEVCEVLGKIGSEHFRRKTNRTSPLGEPIEEAGFYWLNSDGSDASLQFDNDRLVKMWRTSPP